ncbi:MAG: DNA primase [Rikenellaceae bacterium]
MIDRDTIDRIYAAANIVDIIGDYVTLKRKGVNYQACCPFHNEKTPSFVVSPSKGLYRCFGCGKGGNAVTFIMEHEGVNYPEALKIVAKRYGIEVKERELTPEESQRNDNRESMFTLNSWASDYFATYLKDSSEGRSVGGSYFRQKRGFSDATIIKFGLGFCPSKGDTMSREALAKGYKKEFLLSTGLSLQRESDGSLFDRFRDRVIFPVHNISGRIVAFGGRTLRTDKKVAKYQNSPESEIYSKKRELYGLFFAKKTIQQLDQVIMVEGYTDVISMHQAGIENVVSSSGTSLTVDQIRLLSRFTKNITIIYDGDAAGVKAAIRGIDLVLKEGMNVRVVSLPVEHDPDSFARAHTSDEVRQYILDHEENFLSYKAHLLANESNHDPVKRAEMVAEMVESIAQISEPIKRSIFIKECSTIMDIDETILISEVARKCSVSPNDRETVDFIRRQAEIQRRENNVQKLDLSHKIEAGSTMTILERELTKYLLKSGHESVEIRDGAQVLNYNIASLIFSELDEGGMEFRDPTFNAILSTYRSEWLVRGEGAEVPTSIFLESSNPDVCNRTVEILTSDDNYIPSQIWESKQMRTGTDAEIMSVGLPKAVMLYKSKVLESMIKEQQAQLSVEGVSEEEQMAIIQRMSRLNTAKVQIANKLQRLIL